MMHILIGYCGRHPKIWYGHLGYIHHAYNQTLHSSTNKIPFETCFGYLPKSPFDMAFAYISDRDVNIYNEEEHAKKLERRYS